MHKTNYVVGIGASAGSLESIFSFLAAAGSEIDYACVIVQPLPTEYISRLRSFLMKRTKIPVYDIENGMTIDSNNIYILSERTNLDILHGKLYVSNHEISFHYYPIDHFFGSLAQYRSYAIGVIMSGYGADGSLGAQTIHTTDGAVIVENPLTAKIKWMPESAISFNHPDYILNAQQMPQTINSIVDGTEKKRFRQLISLSEFTRVMDKKKQIKKRG